MKFCVQSGLICLQLYPDQEGVSTVPREVELALANGLSLADQPSRALSLLKNTRYMYTSLVPRPLPPRASDDLWS